MATEKQANMSTTDYLRQKAVLDEADHLQDKRQEEMRTRWETGGLPSAQRLYEGDSVPQGMRVIKCSYCGAENLVPQGSRQKYTCYIIVICDTDSVIRILVDSWGFLILYEKYNKYK